MPYNLQLLRETADKCQYPEIFLSHCGLPHPSLPSTPFYVNHNQRKVLKAEARANFVAIQTAPDMGLPLLFAGLALHQATYNTDQCILIACDNWQDSRNTIQMVESLIEHSAPLVDLGLIPKIKKGGWSKNRIEFENGSVIMGAKLTAMATRGLALSSVFINDISYCDEVDVQDHFEQIVLPSLSRKSGKLYVAHGDGKHHKCFNRLWECRHFENVVMNQYGA